METLPMPARGRVLIAEDDAFTRAVLVLLLQADGWTVVEVADGTQALSAARSTVPDLVVTDLRMPGLSGLELATELGRSPGLADVPSIAITSDRAGLRAAAEESARFACVLTKPMEPEVFLDAVHRATKVA